MEETRFVIAQWDGSELSPYEPVETDEDGKRFRAASFSSADEAYKRLNSVPNVDQQALLITTAYVEGYWLKLT